MLPLNTVQIINENKIYERVKSERKKKYKKQKNDKRKKILEN